MAETTFDFEKAWREVAVAQQKRLPRSATNALARIETAALDARNWQESIRAFLMRDSLDRQLCDDRVEAWLPQLAARIDAAPSEIQPFLQMHLAHVYQEASNPWRWGGRRPTKLDDAAATNLPPWAPEKITDTLERQFEKVLAHEETLKRSPVGEWKLLLSPGNMPESCRPTLFDVAVHEALDFYGRTIPDDTLEKGRALIDRLMLFHRSDPRPDALADAEWSLIGYAREFEEIPPKAKEAKYVAALEAFMRAYRDRTEVVTLAYHARAELYRDAGERVRAHELAREGEKLYPKSVGGRLCRALWKNLEKPSFTVETERMWCAPWPDIAVSSENVSHIFFKLVPISFAEFRDNNFWGSDSFYHTRTEKVCKKFGGKRYKGRVWRVDLKGPRDDASHTFKTPVPRDLKPGHYVLLAAMDDDFIKDDRPVFVTTVTVSDLAMTVSADNGRLFGRVFRAESGKPAADVSMEYWSQGERSNWKREFTFKTAANGTFQIDRERLYGYVRAVDGENEVLSIGTEGTGIAHPSKRMLDHLDLVTDRSLYRPGQQIHFKGVAYHADAEQRDFHVLTGATIVIDFMDPNDKPVTGLRAKTGAWGSFHGTVTAPMDRLTGGYRLKARIVPKDWKVPAASTSCRFNVEEYKRPKFQVGFTNISTNAVLGRAMTMRGSAKTYSGLPVQNAKVVCRVKRSVEYASWWSWFGRSRGGDEAELVGTYDCQTDAEGVFSFSFVPEPTPTADLEGEPVFSFDMTAEVTDGTGETRFATEQFRVGTVAWRAGTRAEGEWLTAAEPVPLAVSVHSHNGEPIAAKGVLTILRLVGPDHPVRRPVSSFRGDFGFTRHAHEKNTRQEDMRWRWENWQTGDEIGQWTVATDAKGAWTEAVKLPVGAYRLAFETKDPQGKVVHAFGNICVFDPTDAAKPLKVPDFFRVERTSVRVGDVVRLFWSSGYDAATCRIRLRHNGETLLDEQTDFNHPVRLLEFPVTDAHRGGIRIETECLRENRIYRNDQWVNVPWDNMELKVESEHLTSRLEPGKAETWSFRVRAARGGESVPAEILAFMYDKSLDAYKGHFARYAFSSHYTPYFRSESWPALQNRARTLSRFCGHFPGGGYASDPSWCARRNADQLCQDIRRFAPAPRRGRAYDGLFAKSKAKLEGNLVVCESARVDALCNVAPSASLAPAAKPPPVARKARAENEENLEENASAPEPPPRRNLQETAFFLPHLETDAEGRFSFTFTAPDAITGWKLFALAHSQDLRYGSLVNDEIVTRKPLMVEPNAPRFAREGDDFRFSVKVTNTEDAPQKGVVSLSFADAETGAAVSVGGGEQSFELQPHASTSVEFAVRIPDGQGFLKYVARAKGTVFTDGEEGWLPVLSRRILVREAVQLQVRGAGTREFAFSNLLASARSDTLRHADLTVRAVSRPAWYAVLALPYLMEFPHECCEQTFSRYYANALGAWLANSDPRIRATFDAWKVAGAEALKSPLETNDHLKSIALDSTPWLREAKHETAARARIGMLFTPDRLAAEQKRCLNRLSENITGGMWPWFPGGHPSEGVTLYILTGFARLQRIAGMTLPSFFTSVCTRLDDEIKERVARRLRKENLPFHVNGFDIRWLYLHTFANVPDPDAKTKQVLMEHLVREWTDLGLEAQAIAAIVLDRNGEKETARDIIASLKERAIVSDEMGMYWKRPAFFSTSLFAAPVSTQAMIVEAFLEIAHDTESVDACRAWMLKQKQTQNWSSTASTADAIYALLLDGGTDLLAGDTLATVTLGGTEVPKTNAEAGTGLYSHRYAPAEIRPEMGTITFSNEAKGGVAWGGVHWSYFEDVLKVRAHEPKELHVEKKYFRKTHTKDGVRLSPVEGVLEQGDELVARIVITSDRVYEYVHLQDERPSCAEPVDVLSGYQWRDGVGYYLSTRDTATHYYIDRLAKGQFVLETSFRVQQRGLFSGGLATIQCMYAPEFTAHSSAEKVTVR